jgi:hypothetical protein
MDRTLPGSTTVADVDRPKSDVSANIRDHVERYVTPEGPKSDVSAHIRDHVERYVTPEGPKSDVSAYIRDHVERYVTPEGPKSDVSAYIRDRNGSAPSDHLQPATSRLGEGWAA